MKQKVLGLIVLGSLSLTPFSTVSAEDCSLSYTIKGWAAFYKTYTGTGTISCPSGKSAKVNLSLKGGGFTFGAYNVTEGKGVIRGIEKIEDVYMTSFMMDGDAGFGKSIEGRWAPKGARMMTFTGKGTGYNLGWALGSVSITQP